MLRKRKPLKPDELYQLSLLVNKQIKEDRFRSQYSGWKQTDASDQIKLLINDYLSQYGTKASNIILHSMYDVETHQDRLCKTVFVFVIKGSESSYIYEEYKYHPLIDGSVFTLNDFNSHGIGTLDDDKDMDLLYLITADSGNYAI